jgi:hypothetical protein
MINERYQVPAPDVRAPGPDDGRRRWGVSALVALAWHLVLGALAAPLAGLGPWEGSPTGLYLVVVLVVPYLLVSLVISLVLCLLVRSRHLGVQLFHGTWTTAAGLLGSMLVLAAVYSAWSSTRG